MNCSAGGQQKNLSIYRENCECIIREMDHLFGVNTTSCFSFVKASKSHISEPRFHNSWADLFDFPNVKLRGLVDGLIAEGKKILDIDFDKGLIA